MPSQDGKGRTVWDILTGRNKRPLTPLELQYFNPLGCRVGNTISFEHENLSGINFVIERLSVYETRVQERKFFHTDYHLKGMSLEMDTPLRLRLRLIPDENETNKLGCKLQLLHLYDEMEWDPEFHDNVLLSESGVFEVNEDDDGNPLEEPRKYWRVDDVLDPYNAVIQVLKDTDGDGVVEREEVEQQDVTYWDYARITTDDKEQEFTEFLTVEMDNKSHYFTFLRGSEVEAFQILVV